MRSSKSPQRGREASRADKYDLYLRSVQVAEHETMMFSRFYRTAYKAPARTLREDFCGTAAICADWVRGRSDRYAIGVDLDPEPLAWGMEHNVAPLSPKARERVTLVRGDVRTLKSPPVDVLAAQNFSFFVFKQRADLLEYFKAAYRNLADKGVFVLDMLGGPEVQREGEEETRKLRGFTYVWEQVRFDPITAHCLFRIHFRFKDGSALSPAFEYDWRLWTMPEIRELLTEAGFPRVDIYWEGSTRGGKGDGRWQRKTSAESDPAWVAYVVAIK